MTLLRYDGSSDVSDAFKGNLLAISSGNVTISNVTLDGNKENVCTDTTETSGHLLHITGSTTVVTLGDDATVCDNKKVSGRGSGVYIGGGTFKMAGGTVTGNEAGYGAGIYIYNDAIFEISGGAISENKATSTYGGGGVYVRGTFKMTDGTISSNSAMNGGGVYIPTVGVGSFTMDGGRIIGNTASSQGGGVYVNGTFTMSGGEITGNTVGSSGNGVYKTSDGTFTRTGGTVQSD